MSNPRATFDKSSQSPQDGGDNFWFTAKDNWLGASFDDAASPKAPQGTTTATAPKPSKDIPRDFKA